MFRLDFRSRKQIVFLMAPIVAVGAVSIYYFGGWGIALLLVLITGVLLMALRDLTAETHAMHEDMLAGTKRLEAAGGLFAALRLRAPLPPLRGSVVSPDFANLLVSLIHELKPQRVLELGSGVSTTITASVLKDLGAGHLYSVDNELKYAEYTQRTLGTQGISEFATVLIAPVQDVVVSGRSYPWYGLDLDLVPEGIDLLIVDGPPAMEFAEARYPALPILMSKLSAAAVVIIDDYEREGDRSNVRRWLEAFPDFVLEEYKTEKGTAVMRRRSGSGSTLAVVELGQPTIETAPVHL